MDPESEFEYRVPWQSIARYLAGESSRWEAREIEQLMRTDPKFHRFIEALREVWSISPRDSHEIDPAKAWKRFSSATLHPKPRIWPRIRSMVESLFAHPSVRFAVALTLLLVAFSFLLNFDSRNPVSAPTTTMREVSTTNGQRFTIKFSDGTLARLNSSTTIRFRERFTDGIREVSLRGEAFFEVAKIAAASSDGSAEGYSPFIVRAGGAVVQVLGTKFNVKAWPEDERVDVTVANGKVAVGTEQDSAKVVLTRGQMVSVLAGLPPAGPVRVDIKASMAWIDGRLVFRDTPLGEVLKSLERQYDLTFSVSDPQLIKLPLTASFKDESVTEILRIISLTLDLTTKRSDRAVHLAPRSVHN